MVAAAQAEYVPAHDSYSHDSVEDGLFRIKEIVRKPYVHGKPTRYSVSMESLKYVEVKEADAVRNASVFYLGGLLHDGPDFIEKAIGRLSSVISPAHREAMPSKFLAFSPYTDPDAINKSRMDRIAAGYSWNANKLFPVDKSANNSIKVDSRGLEKDLGTFADKLFTYRFCDDKGRLLTSDQFKGFSFVTFSIGGRLAFMVENLLRQRLDEALSKQHLSASLFDAGDKQDLIQKYFNKCKCICIGHAVDWEGMPEHLAQMPKLFLIGRDDAGVRYRESFWQEMHVQKGLDDWPARKLDVSAKFHAPAVSQQVIVLADGVLTGQKVSQSTSQKKREDSHGIDKYTDALLKYRNAGKNDHLLQEFIQALETAIAAPELGITTIGKILPASRPSDPSGQGPDNTGQRHRA